MTNMFAGDATTRLAQEGVVRAGHIVIGLIVGVVIVYQVLTSEVQDHLAEYATLKRILDHADRILTLDDGCLRHSG